MRLTVTGSAMRGSPCRGIPSVAFLVLLELLWAWAGCDLTSNPGGPGRVAPRMEVVVEPEAGLEGAVQIDSLSWRPLPVELGPDLDVAFFEGTFSARFVSLAQREVEVRYDLRFLDEDGFLVDRFIPFGQPVRLPAGQVRRVSGEYSLRADEPWELERVVILRLHARVLPAGG
ncbi:MAG: hypothetical protein AB1505_04530 [Candidatus Latescibacterota bacterium]